MALKGHIETNEIDLVRTSPAPEGRGRTTSASPTLRASGEKAATN